MTQIPDVHYARSGEVSIAYQIIGDGPVDLVFVRGITGDLLSTWDQPLLVRHVLGLAENGRLMMLDKRGTGLSDRVGGVPTLETRMDDVRAMMDAASSERAVLWSGMEGSRITTLFAATYPERTAALIVLNPTAKGRPTPDYPWAPSDDEWRETLREVREGWGEREYFHRLLRVQSPAMAEDEAFRAWFVTHMRRSLTPGAAMAFHRMAMEADVADVLPAVRVPTLILYSPEAREPAEFFARHIPDNELRELPTMRGEYTWVDDATHE
ncbi:MAG TPA: alpha/beta hydrolase, partial [Actinomycetota bacterium]|nr:alpha/beta hydrolase [Actinomycetota bacterium]